jgi:hypothetical protein
LFPFCYCKFESEKNWLKTNKGRLAGQNVLIRWRVFFD